MAPRWILLALAVACARPDDTPARSTTARTREAGGLGRSELPTTMVASPDAPKELLLPDGDTTIDLTVWPTSPEAALLVRDSIGRARVVGWLAGEPRTTLLAELPAGFEAHAIASHPTRRVLFVSGKIAGKSQILSLTKNESDWHTAVVLETPNDVGRLIVGPRPYETNDSARYRLFFAATLRDGSRSIRSATETGKIEYQVVGPKSGVVAVAGNDFDPGGATAPSGTPLAMHPRGAPLLWQDARGCAHLLQYDSKSWSTDSIAPAIPCGGSASITPNGMAYLHWRSGAAGVLVIQADARPPAHDATAYTFLSAPVSVPDGKGVIGIVSKGASKTAVVYAPISVPLADVANAWQLGGTACDEQLFVRNGGLFRRQPSGFQLYSIYEFYAYDSAEEPPFLVTTDLFWENFAAAFNGAFIVLERQQAMPAFWDFVAAANASLSRSAPGSKWARAFAALAMVRQGNVSGEAAHIAHDSVEVRSLALDTLFNFAELKPRGHYTSSPEMQQYFRAVHYLTEAGRLVDPTPLASLPADVQRKAVEWIGVYQPFIAQPRARLVWTAAAPPPLAAYARHPWLRPTVFPLSWGLDNEILESSVFHQTWPPEEQITGPKGRRLMASGVDVATAYGSPFGRSVLSADLAAFPRLGPVLDGIAARRPAISDSSSLYDRWLDALAVEWADSASFPAAPAHSPVWSAKRLQTGLASWASVREATILVNERASAAEAGEGGFEELIAEVPRGYVEPAPKTFEAIASLYDALAKRVAAARSFGAVGDSTREGAGNLPLRQGILRRLAESAADARRFGRMADKELRGQALADSEYEAIREIGGITEHQFKLYKSLANKDLALSVPDPLPKIADVAGDLESGVLEVAVGDPMEWRQIVPYFGRREIALGSVYSYYEFSSRTLYDNDRWRKEVNARPHPPWIDPLISPPDRECRVAPR